MQKQFVVLCALAGLVSFSMQAGDDAPVSSPMFTKEYWVQKTCAAHHLVTTAAAFNVLLQVSTLAPRFAHLMQPLCNALTTIPYMGKVASWGGVVLSKAAPFVTTWCGTPLAAAAFLSVPMVAAGCYYSNAKKTFCHYGRQATKNFGQTFCRVVGATVLIAGVGCLFNKYSFGSFVPAPQP
jgi:hypothetical protein